MFPSRRECQVVVRKLGTGGRQKQMRVLVLPRNSFMPLSDVILTLCRPACLHVFNDRNNLAWLTELVNDGAASDCAWSTVNVKKVKPTSSSFPHNMINTPFADPIL